MDGHAVPRIERIVSGGQTGVDRAALEVAIELGIPHGGWCPLGRLAEDGFIPARYNLRQTDSPNYAVRTEKNVLDSAGTLIIYRASLSGGTELTKRFCDVHRRPLLLINLLHEFDSRDFVEWLKRCSIETINVAGPRESSSPGIQHDARELLLQLLRPWATGEQHAPMLPTSDSQPAL